MSPKKSKTFSHGSMKDDGEQVERQGTLRNAKTHFAHA